MKTLPVIGLVIGCLSLLLANSVQGGNMVHIGLSPYQSPEESKTIRRQLGQFLLQAPAKTSVVVHDAYGLTEIVRFQIPQLRFDAPEVRAQQMNESFAKLADWYKRLPNRETSPLLKGTGALRIPEFLQTLAQQSSSEPFAVLLVGSPFNLSMEEPSFSMAGGKVPSDGHLLTNVAASIYGTAEKVGQLRGGAVHFCYLSETIWGNRLIKESVQRFWGLYVSRQGGLMVDFTADISRAFAVVTQNSHTAVGDYQVDLADSVLDMREVRERTIPMRAVKKIEPPVVPVVVTPPPVPVTVILTNTVVDVQTIYQTNVVVREVVKTVEVPVVPVVTNMPAIPVAPRGRVGMAAWWQADADVDMYVSIPGEHELYYRNTKNKYGEYYRDIRESSRKNSDQAWRDQWEYVELSEKAPTTGLTCWLNLYKVNRMFPGTITGKVRVQHGDGRITEIPFAFTVKSGNGGSDSSNRGTSPYWVKVDLGTSLE